MEPITNQEIENIKSMPRLADSMPYVFPNGNQVNNLSTQCASCGKEILQENIVGTIVPTNAHSATLEAFGLCYDCQVVTPSLCRLADDGTFLTKTATGWQPGRYDHDRPAGLWNRIKELIRL